RSQEQRSWTSDMPARVRTQLLPQLPQPIIPIAFMARFLVSNHRDSEDTEKREKEKGSRCVSLTLRSLDLFSLFSVFSVSSVSLWLVLSFRYAAAGIATNSSRSSHRTSPGPISF